MTPDVNVLLAASRSDHPHHGVARDWLEQAASAAAAGHLGKHLHSPPETFETSTRHLICEDQPVACLRLIQGVSKPMAGAMNQAATGMGTIAI